MRKKNKRAVSIEPEIMTNEMVYEYGSKTEKKELSHRQKLESKQKKKNKKEKKRLKKEKKRNSNGKNPLAEKAEDKTFIAPKNNNINKKNLEEYFEKSKRKNQKLLMKGYKKSTKRKQEEPNAVRNGTAYVFRASKYYTVEELIVFLDEHYLELDIIAKEILDDADFHKWLNEKSESFEESIYHFKELIEIIEKK